MKFGGRGSELATYIGRSARTTTRAASDRAYVHSVEQRRHLREIEGSGRERAMLCCILLREAVFGYSNKVQVVIFSLTLLTRHY